jgi:hypothetical protein
MRHEASQFELFTPLLICANKELAGRPYAPFLSVRYKSAIGEMVAADLDFTRPELVTENRVT